MNNYELFELIGEADDAMIADTDRFLRRRQPAWQRTATVAAAVSLLVLTAAGFALQHIRSNSTPAPQPLTDVSQIKATHSATLTFDENIHGNHGEEIQHYAANYPESAASTSSTIPASSTASEPSNDTPSDVPGPYYEAVDAESLSEYAQDIFCGSYLDEQSRYVIVLTQDTPENRSLICRELEVPEKDVLFKTGTYTHVYLTKLQALITEAMVNRTLPFVVTSGVYENQNRIVVGVTTRDEAEIARILALDTIGGAIEVEYSESVALHELLEAKD